MKHFILYSLCFPVPFYDHIFHTCSCISRMCNLNNFKRSFKFKCKIYIYNYICMSNNAQWIPKLKFHLTFQFLNWYDSARGAVFLTSVILPNWKLHQSLCLQLHFFTRAPTWPKVKNKCTSVCLHFKCQKGTSMLDCMVGTIWNFARSYKISLPCNTC